MTTSDPRQDGGEFAERPAWVDQVQLTVCIDVIREGPGGCSVTVGSPDDSELVNKYGSEGRALEAVRDLIISDIDHLVTVMKTQAP